jgi:RNA polymerase subunit RPABC4/transcription elongation factor Spt4
MPAVILFKVCRECGEEYRPEILRCADCGGELTAQYAAGTDEQGEAMEPAAVAAPRPEAAEAIDPAELRTLHVADRAAELEPLARALGEAAVRFLVRASPFQFALLVRDADVPRASELLRPLLEPADAGEAAAEESGPPACPACGEVLLQASAECPACGLGLAGAGQRPCVRCGKPVAGDAQQCPQCGAAFE